MPKRAYVHFNLLVAAWLGENDISLRAMEVVDDPDRELIVSDAVWLEVMPKPCCHNKQNEIDFYAEVFAHADNVKWNIETQYRAHTLAQTHGIAAMDALAEEFFTAEKPTKPMFRVQESSVQSIRV
jgi:hypothetical protein